MRIRRTQQHLPFDGTRETRRQERVERICQLDKRIEVAAKFFTAEEFERATKIARQSNG